jgi:hypothetical protein
VATHLNNADILSMPDKWEYPWYAAWDHAFQCLPFALIDPAFAKEQLVLLTREWYMHPNGQLPAYEWAFGDVNPPVHAWAAWRVFEIDRNHRGDAGDIAFLERVFHKLMLNFTWWVNRKDAHGRNVFQGGFLGMDNVGVFDRSMPMPGGGHVNQADGTAWMAMFSLNLMRIALELALHNPVYEDIATKFFEHFLLIAEAMTNMAGEGLGLWDEEDGFYYDEWEAPGGTITPLKVRSAVGLIPLFAVEVIEPDLLTRLPGFSRRLRWLLKNRPELAALVSHWQVKGSEDRRLLSLLRGSRMKRLLQRMLDEGEFLAPHGVRSLSRHHLTHPYRLRLGSGNDLTVAYQPGDSDTAPLWREFKLAWADLVSNQPSARRIAATLPRLLRRRLYRGVPNRLGRIPDACWGCRRADAAAHEPVPAGHCYGSKAGTAWLRRAGRGRAGRSPALP